jgi:hypothetical protein
MVNGEATMTWLMLAGGCDFGAIKDEFDGLTNTLVGEGMVIGVANPSDPRIDLEALGYEAGASATLFLADASSAADIGNVLISGAAVTASDGATSADLDEGESGIYTSLPGSGLAYTAENTMTFTVVIGEDTGTGAVLLPPAAGLVLEEAHTAGEPIELDVTGKGYTGTLIVVFDTASGEVTYTNEPQDIKAVYDLTRGNTEVTTVTIPGEAFPGESVYAVGFAGLDHSTSDDFDGMNTLLSGLLAGQLEFQPVVTLTLP